MRHPSQIFLKKLLKGKIAQGAFLSIFWQGTKIILLALWIVIIARSIGASSYGIYAGIAGMATTAGSFVGLGLGLVMYQDAARSPILFDELWHKSIKMTVLSGSTFLCVFIVLAQYLFKDQSIFLLISIGLSELLFYPLMTNAAFAFASQGKIGWSTALPSLMALARLCALLVFLQLHTESNLNMYIWYHLFATLSTGCICILLVQIKISPKNKKTSLSLSDLSKGFGFCATWASSNALSSLDKTLVLKLSGGETAGLYSSMYRFSYILMQPIDALIGAAMPQLFKQGILHTKTSSIIKYLFFGVGIYSLLAGLFIILTPTLLTFLLGPKFSQTIEIIKWCALLVPCYGTRALATNILMASNKVKWKIIIEVSGLFVLFILGYLLIPIYGLRGAVIMLISTEAFLATLSSIIFLTLRHEANLKEKSKLLCQP